MAPSREGGAMAMRPTASTEDGIRRVLADSTWKRLEALLATLLDRRGAPAALDLREFLEAVFWWARTGAPWRDLPPVFGKWDAVYARFRRWEEKGVWKRLFHKLGEPVHDDVKRLLVDSTVIRAHPHAAGGGEGLDAEAKGRSRGGVGTKLHVVACDKRTALALTLTPGQAHDLKGFDATMAELPATAADTVVADRAYDANAVREDLATADFKVVIPARKNRTEPIPHDADEYRLRNQVERLIARLKRLRRLATRYEKLACTFLAVAHLAGIASILL